VKQRVAVGRGLGSEVGADDRAAAGAIVHVDLLAPAVGELLRQHAGEQVGLVAGGQRHDVAYLPGGEGLRGRLSRNKHPQQYARANREAQRSHGTFPPSVVVTPGKSNSNRCGVQNSSV